MEKYLLATSISRKNYIAKKNVEATARKKYVPKKKSEKKIA